jgi:general secretion pathway protein A
MGGQSTYFIITEHLLNFKMDAQSPMALILVGQSELWERLQLQAYAAIRQRIDLQCKLGHYDRSQVGAYIARHLSYAGATRDIFTDGVMNKHRIIDDHMVKRVIAGELA